jgi:hypothetical protein
MQNILDFRLIFMYVCMYYNGFPQGIAVTSEKSVGARQPSNCITVGDRFYGKC